MRQEAAAAAAKPIGLECSGSRRSAYVDADTARGAVILQLLLHLRLVLAALRCWRHHCCQGGLHYQHWPLPTAAAHLCLPPTLVQPSTPGIYVPGTPTDSEAAQQPQSYSWSTAARHMYTQPDGSPRLAGVPPALLPCLLRLAPCSSAKRLPCQATTPALPGLNACPLLPASRLLDAESSSTRQLPIGPSPHSVG